MDMPRWLIAGVVLPALVGWADPAVPVGAPASNQQLADTLARHFQTSGQLHDYAVDIEAHQGVVVLKGSVADDEQWAALMAMAAAHPGVERVVDGIQVRHDGVELVRGESVPDPPRRFPGPRSAAAPSAPAPLFAAPVARPQRLPDGAVRAVSTEMGVGNERIMEPAPVSSYAGGIAPYADTPGLPPYSWPAYTPYNNFASMAYQTQYPAGAWPFIGPPHPYPMIPSGWRRVELNWKKGYWWLKFHAH